MTSSLVGGVLGVLTYKSFGTLLLFGISAALLLFAGSHILGLTVRRKLRQIMQTKDIPRYPDCVSRKS